VQVQTQVEYVLVLKHYFASELFAAVHEALSIVCPNKEVANKTTGQDTGSVCNTKCLVLTVFTAVSSSYQMKTKQLICHVSMNVTEAYTVVVRVVF
jgi:hypothetical protein